MNWRYFEVTEFDQPARHGLMYQPYPAAWLDRLDLLVTGVLDPVRHDWGSPLIVVSGYRSPEYNRRVGGARWSQHLRGRAADITPKKGDARDLHALIMLKYECGDIPALGGLGEYEGFVHVDIRKKGLSGRLKRWKDEW